MITCANCGTRNEDTAKFCMRCGKSLVGLPPVKPKRRVLGISPGGGVLIGLVVIVLGTLVAYYLLRPSLGTATPKVSTPEVPTEISAVETPTAFVPAIPSTPAHVPTTVSGPTGANLQVVGERTMRCRAEADSPELGDLYWGGWLVRVDSTDYWLRQGEGRAVLWGPGNLILDDAEIHYAIASNQIGWVVPDKLLQGDAMSSGGSVEAIYDPADPEIARQAIAQARQVFHFVDSVRHDEHATLAEKIEMARTISDFTLPTSVISDTVTLEEELWDEVVAESLNVLDEILRQDIRSNQVTEVKRQVAGYISLALSPAQAELVEAWSKNFIVPTSFFNAEKTEEAKVAARESVQKVERIGLELAGWNDWDVSNLATREYPWTVEFLGHEASQTNFPTHQMEVLVANNGDLDIDRVSLFAFVLNSEGKLVDILWSGESSLAYGETMTLVARSLSRTGRCRGAADQRGYQLEWWVKFWTPTGEMLSHFETIEVLQRLDELDQVTRLALRQFLEFPEARSKPLRIVVQGNDLYILDGGVDRLYRYRWSEAARTLQTPPEGAILIDTKEQGELLDIVWLEPGGGRERGALLILKSDGLMEYDPLKGLSSLSVVESASWQEPRRAGGFEGNFYLLDVGAKRILKYLPTAGDYNSAPLHYIVEAEFESTVDMAIDGDIYVLLAEGLIMKFTAGERKPFLVEGLEKGFSNPLAIFTNPGIDHIYVVESGRIVELTKEGRFVRQLRPSREEEEAFQELSTVFVDEGKRRLFILSGKRLYLADLPMEQSY